MPFCEKCGKELRDDASFCQQCGAPRTIAANTEPQPVEAPPSRAEALPKAKGTFVNTGVGLLLLGVIFIAVLVIVLASGVGASPQNFINIFRQFVVYLPLALGVALSCRAKGLDLSMGGVMGFSACFIAVIAENGVAFGGVALALILCAVVGLINGVLINYLRVPSVLITIVTGALMHGLSLLLTSGGMPMQFYGNVQTDMLVLLLVALLVLLPGVFLLIFFTRLGKSKAERKKDDRSFIYVLAYILSAVMACYAGYSMMVRVQAAMPMLGSNMEVLLVFIAAVLLSSRALDNRFMPVIGAAFAVFVWQLLSNGMVIYGWNSYIQTLAQAVIAGVMLIVAYACRSDLRAKKQLK